MTFIIIVLTGAIAFLLDKVERLHTLLQVNKERLIDLEVKVQDLQTQIDEAY